MLAAQLLGWDTTDPRNALFGPQFQFSFGMCFVYKENFFFACQQKLHFTVILEFEIPVMY